jgi:hypothetical protein
LVDRLSESVYQADEQLKSISDIAGLGQSDTATIEERKEPQVTDRLEEISKVKDEPQKLRDDQDPLFNL